MLGDTSHLAGGLPIFIMAGVSAVASVWLRDSHARTTARGGLVALIAGVASRSPRSRVGSTALFLVGGGDRRARLRARVRRRLPRAQPARARPISARRCVSSILTVSYLAFSLPAVAAGAAVHRSSACTRRRTSTAWR